VTLVSVVMSTYNRNELLFGRSLPSVLRQTHRDLEVNIVVDGMCDEQMAEFQRRFAELPPRNIRYWRIPRQTYPEDPGQRWQVLGLNARNHALDNAQGEWVAPLDDDDEWTPDHVETLLNYAQATEADFAYGISQYHWPDGRDNQFAGSAPPGVGAFCDGAQLYKNGLGYRYDPECITRGLPEDGDMWERMRDGGVKFVFLPQLVHHYWVNAR
jgi:glycosyltransferase involved in cell wall biosynthesis